MREYYGVVRGDENSLETRSWTQGGHKRSLSEKAEANQGEAKLGPREKAWVICLHFIKADGDAVFCFNLLTKLYSVVVFRTMRSF